MHGVQGAVVGPVGPPHTPPEVLDLYREATETKD